MAYINFKEEKDVAIDQLYKRRENRSYIHQMRNIAIRIIMKLFLVVAILSGKRISKKLQT